MLILALEPRERHGDSEKAFWRRILELSFEGVYKMRKGKSILVKRRASKEEKHEGQSIISIFLEFQIVYYG